MGIASNFGLFSFVMSNMFVRFIYRAISLEHEAPKL